MVFSKKIYIIVSSQLPNTFTLLHGQISPYRFSLNQVQLSRTQSLGLEPGFSPRLIIYQEYVSTQPI